MSTTENKQKRDYNHKNKGTKETLSLLTSLSYYINSILWLFIVLLLAIFMYVRVIKYSFSLSTLDF